MTPLATKYRPATFADMVGQRINAVVLQQMVDRSGLPPAMLFSGPSGVGKTSAARILATELGIEVIEVDAASHGGVAEIRKIGELVRVGSERVVILDEAQSITKAGFESFLKTLEEPPPGTYFVLTTTEPYKIPETILSRLVEFQFRSVTPGDIAARLAYVVQQEEIDVTGDLVMYLANRANGNIRTALQSLDMARIAGVRTIEGYRELNGDHDPAPTLLAALMSGDHSKIFAVLDHQLATVGPPGQIAAELIACIRDVFILKAGGTLPAGGQGAELRRQIALRLEQERLLIAVRILWETRTKLKVSDDPRGNLELAMILVAEALSRGNVSAPAQPVVHSDQTAKPAPKKLSLADLQKRS